MQRKSSVSIARNRIRALVTSDRVNCTPESYEKICRELYEKLRLAERRMRLLRY